MTQVSTDRIAYQKPQPWGMTPDMVIPNLMGDDPQLWAPVGDGVWSRPIHLNVTSGFYVHLLRVKRSGLLQRHRHSGQVHAYVIRGKWYYLEHDWVAEEGGYVFEPPGETPYLDRARRLCRHGHPVHRARFTDVCGSARQFHRL